MIDKTNLENVEDLELLCEEAEVAEMIVEAEGVAGITPQTAVVTPPTTEVVATITMKIATTVEEDTHNVQHAMVFTSAQPSAILVKQWDISEIAAH